MLSFLTPTRFALSIFQAKAVGVNNNGITQHIFSNKAEVGFSILCSGVQNAICEKDKPRKGLLCLEVSGKHLPIFVWDFQIAYESLLIL